jgi:hypothetical protein
MTVRDDMRACLSHLLPIDGDGREPWSANKALRALQAHWRTEVPQQDVVDTLMNGVSVGVVEHVEDGYRLCSNETLRSLLVQAFLESR